MWDALQSHWLRETIILCQGENQEFGSQEKPLIASWLPGEAPTCPHRVSVGSGCFAGDIMLADHAQEASITVNQDGIKSFFSALINAQHYEIFLDDRNVGELTGYKSRSTVQVSSGAHSIYVRAYARDSVSITRIYGFSQTLTIDLAPGEHKNLSCGLLPGPPLRKWFIFGGTLITLLLAFAIPASILAPRALHALIAGTALITIAGAWYGYSSKPGANIYLKELVRSDR